jgi:6-phosphogluconolactonase (cycloisomerase 2 family)
VTPFGFSFGHDDVLIVSDADGGPAATGAVSTYSVDDDGKIAVITPALGDTQKAACWLVVPRNGRFAYTTNAASNSISSYRVSEDGYLTLRDAVAVSTGAGTTPTDMALSDNSQFLYTRNGGNGSVSGFRIGRDGSLTPIASITGVPSGSQGIAAR